MTTSQAPEDDRLARIEQQLNDLVQTVTTIQQDLVTSRQELREEVGQSRRELREEVERWDERFFQFTRDNLNASRTIIITAGSVVILSPVLQAFAPVIQAVVTRLVNGSIPAQ